MFRLILAVIPVVNRRIAVSLIVCLVTGFTVNYQGNFLISKVYSDTQNFIEYEYDAAGNLVGISSSANSAPPDVFSLDPGHIHKDSTITVTAHGENLLQVQVSTSYPGLTISSVEVVSSNRVSFSLSADMDIEIGLADINFVTRLGSDSEPLVVAERVPIISADPNPIVLKPDGLFRTLSLIFDFPFAQDQEFDLKVTDDSILELGAQSIVLPAGSTEISFQLRGLQVGTTSLEISQSANFLALSIPILVTGNIIPDGTYTAYSKTVGVTVFTEQTNQSSQLIVSSPVGIGTYVEQNINGPALVSGLPVEVVLGPIVEAVTPPTVVQGSNPVVLLTGSELDLVMGVSLVLGSGISVSLPFSVNSDGSELTLSLTISQTADTGVYLFKLEAGNGNVTFNSPELTVVSP